jgi:serine/threonine protein kinase
VYEDETNLYLVFKLIEGQELLAFVADGTPLNEETAKQYARCIVKALYYLHQKRLIHRDVKLENVMIATNKSGRKTAVLTDFGLVRECTSEDLSEKCGSLGYIAPELFSGAYGLPADLFSLGVVLFTVLVGRMPFGAGQVAERNMAGVVKF